MFSQDDEGQQGLVLALVFGLMGLVIALVIGASLYQRNQTAHSVKAVPAAPVALPTQPVSPVPPPETPVSAAQTAQAASDAATVRVEQGIVKFYFASGKADLAPGAGEALVDLVKGAQAGRKLVISGFHDPVGDPVKNAALARRRAMAVHNALKALGVAEQQIEIRKPETLMDGGSAAEARRVEISLQ
ncbi:MAG: OmpA family protein [Polaromonas sp.]|nr:OmpA family protein [Polaromonas sp.]